MDNKELILKKISDYQNIKSDLYDLVYDIFKESVKVGRSEGSVDDYDFTETEIEVKWSSSWSYGGHASGTEDFPIELLWSDYKKYFHDWAIKKQENEKRNKELDRKNKEAYDLSEFNRLK